ncbi:MAG: alkaline phosphatase family protein [Acidimicrobiales bacterium]|nr:alkaline phosphatase family protein [Acidimicrobiales bacterium]
MKFDRRTFVKGALGATGAAVLGPSLARTSSAGADILTRGATAALPDPSASGIEHIVVVMMENRSFDHLLGWLPHANGMQKGLSYADPSGTLHKTFEQDQFNGCGFADPDHSYSGGRIQYNGGKMDGFLTDTANDSYAISYYTKTDRPFTSALARHYTTCDSYFCSILGPTYPNRIFHHAGQTDRLDNTLTVSTLPTIWDQLNQTGGPTGKYYYSDLPILALWGSKYTAISEKVTQFFSDAAAGTLPNVSYVDPSFIGEGNGTSNDDHPLADIRAGDAFLSQLFHAVATGPGWGQTVFIINYDEWGGFFEHVAPSRVTAGVPIGASPSSGVDQDLDANGHVLLGFRVPCIVASPFSSIGRGGGTPVASGLYDHTSVLKFIEWRWSLNPLTQRDASSATTDPGNLADVLNFAKPTTKVSPSIPNLPTFVPTACPAPPTGAVASAPPASTSGSDTPSDNETWTALQHSGLLAGWK